MTASTLHAAADQELFALRRDGRHDFNFLHGNWRVHHRRLREPLTGSTEWYEFEGTAVERPLWDTQANIEEVDALMPGGVRLRGLALRLYDPIAKHWTIHWSSAATGTLDPPMTGTFENGVGTFHGRDEFRGKPIMLRFLWSLRSTDALRWEQAFSADDAATWETNWVMDFTRVRHSERSEESAFDAGHSERSEESAFDRPLEDNCNVIELRQYSMRPGQRDTLIDIFEREFIEGQEDCGMQVIAQFRDLDRPDVFTWMRGFSDMSARRDALTAFYDGPVWARNRDAANATMITWDNVRLLRPASPGSGFQLGNRATHGAGERRSELVVATIYTLSSDAGGFAQLFEHTIAPCFTATGAQPIAMLETETTPNSYPRLPLREGERAFVWFARFESMAAHELHVATLAANRDWIDDVRPLLDQQLAAPAEVWRLVPTARSRDLR